jgi:hypothetical protein
MGEDEDEQDDNDLMPQKTYTVCGFIKEKSVRNLSRWPVVRKYQLTASQLLDLELYKRCVEDLKMEYPGYSFAFRCFSPPPSTYAPLNSRRTTGIVRWDVLLGIEPRMPKRR